MMVAKSFFVFIVLVVDCFMFFRFADSKVPQEEGMFFLFHALLARCGSSFTTPTIEKEVVTLKKENFLAEFS